MGILNHHMYCHICDHDDCICPSTATPVTDPKELKNYDENGFYKRPHGRKTKAEKFSDELRRKGAQLYVDIIFEDIIKKGRLLIENRGE